MLINELSKRTGITAHTIRFYEKSGLISGKRDPLVKTNKYFLYDEEYRYSCVAADLFLTKTTKNACSTCIVPQKISGRQSEFN